MISFNLPAGDGGQWTQEAAESLVGQETIFDGQLVRVTSCHLSEEGSLKGTVVYVQKPEES